MSHELRTPLNAILGFAQLLHRDRKTPLSERQLERVEHVLNGGEHLLRLIDEVLDLARVEAGRVSVSLEPVALPAILDEAKSTLDAMVTRLGIQLEILTLPEDLPEVLADRTRLKQILMNYGSNAIKYGRRGGHAEISAQANATSVRICVRDDGIGIPENKHDKVFQPFQRAGQETGPIEGTGIGLAITKRLAELMQACVGFQSRADEGSVFWIELPIAGPHTPRARAATRRGGEPNRLSGPDGPRFTVVYIEDNPSNIAFMEDFVADYERIDLLTAPSAEIGIELVRARVPDAVIMDLNLPGMNGLEATSRLRQWPETKDIPVIGLSAAAMMRDATRVNSAGFYRYLTKPVHVEELARTLDQLLMAAARRR
jgi:CheY-like chemotaxis protein/two-component sensor histidine kinase